MSSIWIFDAYLRQRASSSPFGEGCPKRVDDGAIMGLLKKILKSSGSRGVPQGGVISPLLSNIYLNEVDRMLQRAKRSPTGKWTADRVRPLCGRSCATTAHEGGCYVANQVRLAAQEMRVGPSEPACRSRLQTASESWRSRVAVGSVRGKGALDVSGEGHGDERKRTVR